MGKGMGAEGVNLGGVTGNGGERVSPVCVVLGVVGRSPPFGRVGLCAAALRSGPRRASDGLRPRSYP